MCMCERCTVYGIAGCGGGVVRRGMWRDDARSFLVSGAIEDGMSRSPVLGLKVCFLSVK